MCQVAGVLNTQLGGASPEDKIRIYRDVDAGDLAAGQGGPEGRDQLGRILYIVAAAAKRLDHAVVPGGGELGGRGALGPEDHDLRPTDLAPGGVVGHQHGHRQLVADAGLEVEAVEPE